MTPLCLKHCYTSRILTLIVSQVSSLQRSQVSHFSHKVTSVACCSQVSQVSKKECCHDAYVMPIMTWEGHLKHLKHLIWKRRNESTSLQTFFHLKAPQKLSFGEERSPLHYLGALALPHTLSGSVIKLLWPFWGSSIDFESTGAPLKPTREHYNTLMVLLRERYLFRAVVKLLRWMGEGSFHSWNAVGFESLVHPWS